MRTATYNVDVASDRRRRENVPRHILCSADKESSGNRKNKSPWKSENLISRDLSVLPATGIEPVRVSLLTGF